jgi:hypothetical protein
MVGGERHSGGLSVGAGTGPRLVRDWLCDVTDHEAGHAVGNASRDSICPYRFWYSTVRAMGHVHRIRG